MDDIGKPISYGKEALLVFLGLCVYQAYCLVIVGLSLEVVAGFLRMAALFLLTVILQACLLIYFLRFSNAGKNQQAKIIIKGVFVANLLVVGLKFLFFGAIEKIAHLGFPALAPSYAYLFEAIGLMSDNIGSAFFAIALYNSIVTLIALAVLFFAAVLIENLILLELWSGADRSLLKKAVWRTNEISFMFMLLI